MRVLLIFAPVIIQRDRDRLRRQHLWKLARQGWLHRRRLRGPQHNALHRPQLQRAVRNSRQCQPLHRSHQLPASLGPIRSTSCPSVVRILR